MRLVLGLLRLKFREFKEGIPARIDTTPSTAVQEVLRAQGADWREEAIRLLTRYQIDLDRSLTDIKRDVASNEEARQTLGRWISVMLVTFVETYLQDVMSEVARIEPRIMNDTKQAAEYDDVVAFATIAELAEELRRRWARNFTSDGGPTKWATKLAKQGAGTYDPVIVATLERLWGVRHTVIHNAGRATYDFICRHQPPGVTVGQLIPILGDDVTGWLRAIGTFVDQTDLHFVGFLKRKATQSSQTATAT